MRRLIRYAFAAGLAALCALPLPATGQSIKPGEEGALADFLPPEPGRHICYARTYTADHLRQHPKQTVTEIAFRLAYYRHDPDEFAPHGQRNYYFALLAKRRGGSRTLTAMGECGPNGASIGCGVECDGGGVSVSRKPGDKILVSLGEDGRIRMSEGCDEGDSVDLESGADDREFLLSRVEDSACPAYEDW